MSVIFKLLEWNISFFFFPTVHEEMVPARVRSGVFLPPVFSVWRGCEKGGRQTAPLHRQHPVLFWGSIPLHHWGQFCSRQLLPTPHHPHTLWVRDIKGSMKSANDLRCKSPLIATYINWSMCLDCPEASIFPLLNVRQVASDILLQESFIFGI